MFRSSVMMAVCAGLLAIAPAAKAQYGGYGGGPGAGPGPGPGYGGPGYGDGHAAQGAGELTGDALETSMEFAFSVDAICSVPIDHAIRMDSHRVGGTSPGTGSRHLDKIFGLNVLWGERVLF